MEQMTDDLCQCPKCGRMHRDLGFGKPPEIIAGPDPERLICRVLSDCRAAGELTEEVSAQMIGVFRRLLEATR